MKYSKKKKKKKKKKIEKRKIIWFYSTSINVGKYFLKLIDKHLNHNNILHKIFKRKTLKISYSCTKKYL